MRRIFLPVVAVILAACAAHAQQPPLLPAPQQQAPPPAAPPAAPPAPPPTAPAVPPSAVAPSAGVVQMTPERLQRIYHIRQLEGVLTNAVKAGASTLAYQMQIAEPSLFVTTNARTRGFELEGFGIFFDVDVPAMLQSAVFTLQMRQEQLQRLDSLRATVANAKVDPGIRKLAQLELNRAERMLGLAPTMLPSAAAKPAGEGTVTAATIDPPPTTDARMVPAPVPPIPDLGDPNERYTEAIKDKLIDAMLTYGTALKLDDQEWLVVGARASSDIMPGQLDDAASILLRIKGEDLNAYVLKKLTRDEVIKRIEIKIG